MLPSISYFKSATPSDIPDSEVVSLPGVLGGLQPRDLSRLDGIWVFCQIDPAEMASIRSLESQRLGHQMNFQALLVQCFLHDLHVLERDERIEQTVETCEW